MTINESAFRLALSGQTTICQKVFESVPKSAAWSASEIYSDLRRRQVGVRDFRTFEGCLNTLVRVGLIKESRHSSGSMFTQVIPRKANVKAEEIEQEAIDEERSIEVIKAATTPPPIIPAPQAAPAASTLGALDILAPIVQKLERAENEAADIVRSVESFSDLLAQLRKDLDAAALVLGERDQQGEKVRVLSKLLSELKILG